MGKKSRLKRERRDARAGTARIAAEAIPSQQRDSGFESLTIALKAHFVSYRAADVILSLTASELWLPNRSSLTKHALAMLVCLSIPPTEFEGRSSIASYDEFADFLDKLRFLLPPFPMLEDFVPEADWGEIRVRGATGFEPIFYGGSVERIPDFIEAFRLLAADEPQALADMNLAVASQRHLVESIPSGIVGSADPIRPGHMEKPSAEFWAACRQALQAVHANVQPLIPDASNWTVAELGSLRLPSSMNAFADIVMTKTALPLLFVRASEYVVPVAPRAATSTVLDLWSERVKARGASELDKNRRPPSSAGEALTV